MKSNRFQRLLKQSLTISASKEGPNIFAFTFSNCIGNVYLSQVFSGVHRARLQGILQAFMFIKVFHRNRIPI